MLIIFTIINGRNENFPIKSKIIDWIEKNLIYYLRLYKNVIITLETFLWSKFHAIYWLLTLKRLVDLPQGKTTFRKRSLIRVKSYISYRKFYQLNTPYSANKLEQISIIKVAGDSRKFFHLTLSQWFHKKSIKKWLKCKIDFSSTYLQI